MTPDAKDQGPNAGLRVALMIESVLLGGAEMVVFQMAEELRGRGHVVLPVVPLGRDGWLLDRFRDVGIAWHTYDLHRPVDWGLPGRMAATLGGLGVDVVHSHEFVMAVYGTAASRRLGVPHVITMHGNREMTDRLRRRLALRWAMRRSRATVAVSQDTRRHLQKALGLRDGVIDVIPNGIPARAGDRDRVRRELGLASGDLLILAVGSLVERKGHAVLIRALHRLRGADLPSWRLAIAGTGVEQERLAVLVQDLGLGDRVHLLGPRNDVPDLQAATDLFVMPSFWEGLPLAVLEAMHAGRAIVASRTAGIPEAIDDEEHGLLVAPGDEEKLAQTLARVMGDETLRARLGDAAYRRASERFTIAAMTDAYERLYR